MRFNTKMIVFTVVPAVLFGAAVAVGLWGMRQSSADFERYLAHDQLLAQNFSDMYAQGLQTGQAIRNIVLDPANGKAYANLKDADKAFAEALTSAQAVSEGSAFRAHVDTIRTLREKHLPADFGFATLPALRPIGATEYFDVWRLGLARASHPAAAITTGCLAARVEKVGGDQTRCRHRHTDRALVWRDAGCAADPPQPNRCRCRQRHWRQPAIRRLGRAAGNRRSAWLSFSVQPATRPTQL